MAEPSASVWLGAIVLVSCAMQFVLIWFREFDPDEFQSLHTAWYFSKGFLPYVDFFEHHTPGIYFLLAPLIRFFQPDTDIDSAFRLIFTSRLIMWTLSLMILGATWKIGRAWRGKEAGASAAAILAFTIMFLEKAIEVRVDVPAPLLFMASLYVLFKASKNTANPSRIPFVLSGFLFGCAVVFTQKMLMAAPGLFAAMAWYALDNRAGGNRTEKILRSVLFWASALVPFCLTLAYFFIRDAAGAFLYNNFLLNSQWRWRFNPSVTFDMLLRQSPIQMMLGISGFLIAITSIWRRESVQRGDFFLAIPFASFLAGAYVIPVPYREYFMEFLPLGALLAAAALSDMMETMAVLRSEEPKKTFSLRIIGLSVLGVCLFLFRKDFYLSDPTGLSMAFFLILAAIILALISRSSGWPRIIAVMALSIHGARQFWTYFDWTNMDQIENLKYVQRVTDPKDTMLDGWNGMGVFRPHAWHYFFLHPEMRYMIDPPEMRSLLNGFKSGSIAPKLIFMDEHIKGLPPPVTDYIRHNYQPTIGNYRGTFMMRRAKKSAAAPRRQENEK